MVKIARHRLQEFLVLVFLVHLVAKRLRPDKDVFILQGGGQSERFAALKAGVVDGAIVSPPLNLAGRQLGFNEVIDLSDSGVAYAHQLIVATKDYLDRNSDTTMRTLRALIQGLSLWKDPAKKPQVLKSIAQYLRLDAEKQKDQLEETYRYYSKTFSDQAVPDPRRRRIHSADTKKKPPGSQRHSGEGLRLI